MSKLMIILGIIVAAAGAVLGALIYVSPGEMQVRGLTYDVASVLLVGGLGLVGLGGVIAAMEKTTAATRELRDWLTGQDGGQVVAAAAAATAAVTADAGTSEFSADAVTPPPFTVPTPEPASSVTKFEKLVEESRVSTDRAVAETRETIAAIDKANSELKQALGDETEPAAEPPAAPAPEAAAEATEEVEDTQLFVVEERLIRGRPARVLSDGTVEAETDDGWMRFENLEHLEEYLDAMSPGQA
ncbi:hypothetical protein [Taklimakanibacter albus]|uniref:Uncharacterized protein n=1 Tax=Taklimakanibacter albus TaxID=2800327 RepID=A0ACC5RA46_9HYPH|nr:hypothetical protein [Aestuariivirga sp. YIM B02566]MBK1869549.1 hypothetical protein [Aestuariivirga sp. YIM B02566]